MPTVQAKPFIDAYIEIILWASNDDEVNHAIYDGHSRW